MKQDQVKVGNVYSAKITDKVVPVRIDAMNEAGGWNGTNLQTNRKVRIKSAQKLRGEVDGPKPNDETPAEQPERARKKLTSAERKALTATPKPTPEPKVNKPAGNAKANKEPKAKKLSLIDAAAQVLAKSKEPMNTKQIVEQVIQEKLWSTNAATPHATLYSAILREMRSKGKDAQFVKVDRGMFTIVKGA